MPEVVINDPYIVTCPTCGGAVVEVHIYGYRYCNECNIWWKVKAKDDPR